MRLFEMSPRVKPYGYEIQNIKYHTKGRRRSLQMVLKTIPNQKCGQQGLWVPKGRDGYMWWFISKETTSYWYETVWGEPKSKTMQTRDLKADNIIPKKGMDHYSYLCNRGGTSQVVIFFVFHFIFYQSKVVIA